MPAVWGGLGVSRLASDVPGACRSPSCVQEARGGRGDAMRSVGPRLGDVASVSDLLRAAQPASDVLWDVSEARTRRSACVGQPWRRPMG